MFMGTHADHVIVAEAAAVPVPRELPFAIGAAIGCGITTGLVPAMDSSTATLPDAVVAVMGCGIVGLSAIAGARLAGVKVIVAIDRSLERLELAGRLGADVTIDTSREDAVARVRDLSAGRGADHVFEAAGNAEAMRTALESVRPGGELTLLGKLALHDDLVIRFGSVMGNKTIRRLAYGGARPQRDFPRMRGSTWRAGYPSMPSSTARCPWPTSMHLRRGRARCPGQGCGPVPVISSDAVWLSRRG